jgi:hypothetical protein
MGISAHNKVCGNAKIAFGDNKVCGNREIRCAAHNFSLVLLLAGDFDSDAIVRRLSALRSTDAHLRRSKI